MQIEAVENDAKADAVRTVALRYAFKARAFHAEALAIHGEDDSVGSFGILIHFFRDWIQFSRD